MKKAENKKGRAVAPKTKSKTSGSSTECQRVFFACTCPEAGEVVIAGSFNEWDRFSTRLTCGEQGQWTVELQLPPGRYEYLLVVDGEWLPDPAAEESVPNPHGGRNSVLTVAAPSAKAKAKAKTARARKPVSSSK